MFKDKTILLGVTGSIAAYKAAALASLLVKTGASVHVLMTKNATNFITPITFETLTGHKCLVDTFDRNFEFSVEHVSLASQADAVMVAPASANLLAKMAMGLADDMLTTTLLACTCPIFVSPAMNTRMYENPAVQENIQTLKRRGITVIDPASGRLACGDVGAGKMPEPPVLFSYLERLLAYPKDLSGKKILITAGPTRENVDPVRYLTNRSTGKMGYALAKIAMLRGADVTLVSGPVSIEPPSFVEVVPIWSAQDMFDAVTAKAGEMDIIIKAAAVADYRPSTVAEGKIKKKDGDLFLPLSRTEDILGYLGSHKREGQFLCGFSMETENLVENSRKKLVKKNLDLIACNNVLVKGAGFATDTNVLTLISPEEEISLPLMSKEEAASLLLDEIIKRMEAKK